MEVGKRTALSSASSKRFRAVFPEHDLRALGVHRHQERMGPQRRGREGPHG